MKTTVSEPKLLWCWNGSELAQKTLALHQNDIEWWYQETTEYNTYDPYFVDEARDVVHERVGDSLVREEKKLSERLEQINMLLKSIQL